MGSRLIQRAFVESSDEIREAMAMELRGHVWEAMGCPHANFVLQRCVVTTRCEALQFIVNELTATPGLTKQVACHRHGCRVLQRILEHCSPEQTARPTDDIVNSASDLSMDPYGNYVVQKVFEVGSASARRRLAQAVALRAVDLGANVYGRAVVSTALASAEEPERHSMAVALLNKPGLLPALACTWHGHFAAKWALRALRGDELEKAYQDFFVHSAQLKASKCGRNVLTVIDALIAGRDQGCEMPAVGLTRL